MKQSVRRGLGQHSAEGRRPQCRPRTERDFAVPPSLARPKRVFLCCHYCGYSPARLPPGAVCPKCGGHSWERYALPLKVLEPRGR